ncbi:MAG TPA: type II toxin-antitoxin system prevent-host-death family antitoxin [Clostridia bacterium]|nr:type II toxin-antitoxin system prevent-host-death family antitoxin [Clostridia bacterium]
MKTLKISTIRNDWSSVIRNAERGARTIIVRRGKPAAAIIFSQDYEFIQRLRARQPRTKN